MQDQKNPTVVGKIKAIFVYSYYTVSFSHFLHTSYFQTAYQLKELLSSCKMVLFNHCMYLYHISLCLQTLTRQEQVSLASLVLRRQKAQWEKGEPRVHTGTATDITSFK